MSCCSPHHITKRSTLLLTLIALLTLGGCQQLPSNTSEDTPEVIPSQENTVEQELNDKAEEALQERFNDVAQRLRAICVAPENKAYYDHTPCLPTQFTEQQLSNRHRITKNQKDRIAKIFHELHQLNEETRTMMIHSGIAEYAEQAKTSRATTDPLVQENQDALLSGSITWGEYNQTRKRLAEQLSSNKDIED